MRTSAGAAVGVITEGVDVHATLGVGVVAGDVPGDLGLGGLGSLLEGDVALDVGVTTDDSDWEESSRQLCYSCFPPILNRPSEHVDGVNDTRPSHVSSCSSSRAGDTLYSRSVIGGVGGVADCVATPRW